MDSKLDVLIVGTGFAGVWLIHHLRQSGFRVIAIEASSQLGGVWNLNTYPGARVDIEVPTYSLALPEVWKAWKWTERFPGREELQTYFRFVDEKLRISQDCVFNSWVESARWVEEENRWIVRTKDGKDFQAKWFIPCVGYAAKPYVPDLKGLYSFTGHCSHTAQWPKAGIDLEGKRVAVIGTEASGVQVIQTIAPIVKELVVYQRTPAVAVPMQQRTLEDSDRKSEEEMQQMYGERTSKFDGGTGGPIPRSAIDDSPEQREIVYETLWKEGGFSFWSGNYQDLFASKEAADLAYLFWKRRTRARVEDVQLKESLAPDEPPFAFGTKRVPLEQTYYDVFNLQHVSLIDLQKDPILEIHGEGIQTASGKSHDFDVIILATGFDIATGSLTQIDIRGTQNQSLASQWRGGVKTYLGMSVHGFPNMLFPYGPQSPSNLCNGPLCAEVQGDWITQCLQHMRSEHLCRLEAERLAQEEWTKHATGLLGGSLFESTRSYYWGDNIPGKKRELLFYFGGVPTYKAKIDEIAKERFRGFKTS